MPEVIMPRLSDTMQEGTITRWLKKAGDEVKKGDILAEVETDKANMEVESYDSGILEQILVQEGEVAPIGKAIARIGTGEHVQQQPQEAAQQPRQKPQEVAQPVQARSSAPVVGRPSENSSAPAEARPQEAGERGRIKVSPLARRMAEEHGINLQQIQGTGPGGRIVRDDIQDFLEQQRAQPAPAAATPAAPEAPAPAPAVPSEEEEVIALTSMQKTIVRRMTESKQTVPHIYIRNEVDMTDALALRQTLNASAGEGGVKISVNDLIIKACALALEKFPEVNTSLRDGQFIRHKRINIGFAVDIPNGLVVPVIRDSNIKGVRSIARESRALIEKAQAGRLSVADLSGGTFSISNLGMMDVTDFDAVVNPPEAAILAVGAARKRFVPIDGQPVIRDLMSLTVSADHRIIYGATTARFLQEIKRLLQNPYSLLG
jgi:pyruvate dehydrogenase E2 component (dihydrolipoamide acetyltransferase)